MEWTGPGQNRTAVQKRYVDSSTRLAHVWILVLANVVSLRTRTSHRAFSASHHLAAALRLSRIGYARHRSSGRGPGRTPHGLLGREGENVIVCSYAAQWFNEADWNLGVHPSTSQPLSKPGRAQEGCWYHESSCAIKR